jgi:hypothetical protein
MKQKKESTGWSLFSILMAVITIGIVRGLGKD